MTPYSRSSAHDVRGAQSGLLGAVHHVDAVVCGGHLVGQLAGAIGAAVVDHQHVHVGQCRVQSLDDLSDVVPLVVGRDHHQHLPEFLVRLLRHSSPSVVG
jgi:hypothetical protein